MARQLWSRRGFLAVSAMSGAALCWPTQASATSLTAFGNQARRTTDAATTDFLEPDSTAFATADIGCFATLSTNSNGDLWPSCWADDDHVYAANGDGQGFGSTPMADVVVNRIIGTPETGITGSRLAGGDAVARIYADSGEYNRKPTGMLAVDGNGDGHDELYLAVQDLRYAPAANAFDDAPNASISVSTDYGNTWRTTDQPMFGNHVFTTIMFLDFGQSQQHVRVLGPDGSGYAYAYGLDNNWRDSYSGTVSSPTDLFLARVPITSIQDRNTWQFYRGNLAGVPLWSSDIDDRSPVLSETRRVYPTLLTSNGPTNLSIISQGSVVYNPGLKRYLYTSWTEYTFEFYEAPQPWGPWRLFMTKDFGGYPWFGSPTRVSRLPAACPGPKNGGYASSIPSKFISEDGQDMWLQANWFVGVGCGAVNYDFSLRRLRIVPFQQQDPMNQPDSTKNLARVGEGVTTIEKSAHYGHTNYYNDGSLVNSEDSYDNSPKSIDFWGYQWSRPYHINRVVYTSGDMFVDGGWFDTELTVQVRRNFQWHTVANLEMSPAYPYNNTAGPHRTFTFRFDDTWGDGVRITGSPGGTAHFTSIAELEVYFDPTEA